MSENNPSSVQVIYIKFIVSAVAGSMLLMTIVYLIAGESSFGLQVGIVAAYWCALARYWINEAFKLGQRSKG